MPSLRYINSKGIAVDIYSAPYQLIAVEGLGGVEADIQTTKSPFQQGATFIDAQLNPREVSVQLTIRGKTEEELIANRRTLSEVFNPALGLGHFEYTDVTGTKVLYTVPTSVPYYPDGLGNRSPNFQKALINLLAPNPMFTDAVPNTIRLEDYVSNFRFPFSFPVHFAVRGDLGTIYNEGHMPAPLKITFRGPALNPQITKLETGETIRIKRMIPEGYSLIITTDFDNQSAEIVGPDGVSEDAMGYLDLSVDWSFFMLGVGENRISFITDGGSPEVYIEYRTQYVGI